MELILGSDVEFLLRDIETGQPKSAVGKLKATKEDKLPLDFDSTRSLIREDWSEHTVLKQAYVHEDNVALEVNSPVFRGPSAPRFLSHFLTSFFAQWRSYKLFPGYRNVQPSWYTTAWFEDKALRSKGAKTFGCDPFLDAYDPKKRECRVYSKQFGNFRTAGFHLHFDFSNEVMPPEAFVHLLDFTLYYPLLRSLLPSPMQNEHEVSTFLEFREGVGYRLRSYGAPGAYRRTPYGIEYRALPTAKQVLTHLPRIATLFQIIADAPDVLQKEYFQVPWARLNDFARSGEWGGLEETVKEVLNQTYLMPMLWGDVPLAQTHTRTQQPVGSRLFTHTATSDALEAALGADNGENEDVEMDEDIEPDEETPDELR